MDKDPNLALLERCYRRADESRDKDLEIANPFTGGKIPDVYTLLDRLYRGVGSWDLAGNMDTWASRPNKPIGFMAVESYTTQLTDNNPTFTVLPREDADVDLSDGLRAVTEWWWEWRCMPMKVALAVKASRIYGTGWLYVYRDEDGTNCRVLDSRCVRVDPDCTVEDYDPAYVVIDYKAQLGDLKRKYPDADWNNRDENYRIGVGERSQPRRYEEESSYNPAKSVMVYELWYKDPSRIEWDDEEELPGYKVKKSKPAYKGGRRMVFACGLLLKDEPNPYKHGEMPFTPIHAYPVPGRFYGMGDISNILGMWIMRNRYSQYIYDQTVKSGGGWIFLGKRSGVDPRKLTNVPYLQNIPCDQVADIRVERPPQPSRHIVEDRDAYDRDIMDAVGQHEVSQGAKTPGNPVTAEEISILSESDRTRMRMASRWINWALERVGRQVLSMTAQYGDLKNLAKMARMPEPPKGDMATSGGKLLYDIKVADSSTLPASKQAKIQQVQMLLSMGVITPEQVLRYKMLDIPNATDILRELDQAKAAPPPEAQMPPQGPPEGGPPVGPPDALAQMQAPQVPPAMPMDMGQAMPMGQGGMPDPAIVEQIAAQLGVAPEEAMMLLMQGGQQGAVLG